MKIEIKLKDPKYCDGCPCIGQMDIGTNIWCEVDGGMFIETYYQTEFVLRPQQCIDKYGE